ncbi:MAG: hypothetical protein OEZ34_13520, partial [Spirochaetia bacterium]|nr:hypothetical protein [Spirochaetia bacterium]
MVTAASPIPVDAAMEKPHHENPSAFISEGRGVEEKVCHHAAGSINFEFVSHSIHSSGSKPMGKTELLDFSIEQN